MKSSYRRFLLAILALAIVSTPFVFWPKGEGLKGKFSPVTSWEIPGWALPQFLRPKPRIERVYRDCAHREEIPLPPGVEWRWAGKKELEVIFPSKDGWVIRQEKSGRFIISQEIQGLCPADASKRHLAEFEGRVAVYQGPAGSAGRLERVLELKFTELPPQWQERIRQGQAEFQSEEELLQALDNLDEYYSADAR